ncbi:MAG: hypothetical protein WC100_18750 [Sterolibacterium sp.]
MQIVLSAIFRTPSNPFDYQVRILFDDILVQIRRYCQVGFCVYFVAQPDVAAQGRLLKSLKLPNGKA